MDLKINLHNDLILASTEGNVTEGPRETGIEPLLAHLGPTVYSRKVLLDLSRTDFISSSGLGWLISCHKKFEEAGGQLVIHSIAPMVWRMISLMRLDRVLQTAPDLANAKRRIEAGA